jgi:NAD(P)-dependent dehydrogenase (short-subunit alcohol dehydrogenase family)
MSPEFQIDPSHLLLIGAGPGVGAAVVRRFGRESFRSTLVSRGEKLQPVAAALRQEGILVDTLVADASDLDTYRSTLESLYAAPGAPAVLVYNASILAPDTILTSSVEHLRTAYDVDVLGGVVAAQVAAPAMRGAGAGAGTILFTGGGFADYPVPALASLSLGKAALRSAATLIANEVASDGVHAASITIVGQVVPGTAFDPNNIAELFWTAHTSGKDTWQTGYRFEGADTDGATDAEAGIARLEPRVSRQQADT